MIYCPLGKSVNNRVPTYPLKSLIRSYSGPNFVMDGESYLPYSPDHLAIIAMLEDISPVVKVDGNPVTQTDPKEARTVRPGQTISTAPGASVTVYFSDGSVTYMDGDSELLIQPNTQVEKNDKDGIATKIRLKLLQGSIWNKVIRLAEKSEFNIETTSAIAGVRGTEFGISADGYEMVIKSGSVAARKKTSAESNATAQIIIDKNDSFKNEQISPDVTGNILLGFGIPDSEQSMQTAGTPVSHPANYEKYYLQPYNNNLEPRLNEINVPTNSLSFRLLQDPLSEPHLLPLKKILVYEKKGMGSPVSTWILGTDFNIDSQMNTAVISDSVLTDFFITPNFERSFIFYFEDSSGNRSAPSHPAIMVQTNAFLTYAMLYGDEAPLAQQGGQGQGGGGQCTSGETQMQTCPIPNGYGKETRTCLVGGTWGTWSNCLLVSCIPGYDPVGNECLPSLATLCDAGNGFLYTSGGYAACWKVAAGLESCTEVCSAIAIGNDHLDCSVNPDWTVDSNLCTGLGYAFNSSLHDSDFSPVVFAGSQCRNDTDNARSCTATAITPYKRICRCE